MGCHDFPAEDDDHVERVQAAAPPGHRVVSIAGRQVEYDRCGVPESEPVTQPSLLKLMSLPVTELVDVEPKGEVRVTDPTTGGEKGQKLARFDLIPPDVVWELAEHLGKGARKYAARNWQKGYDWSLSYAAAMRHLSAFWNGEDIDPETGSKHIIAALCHCVFMAWFMEHYPEGDDRWKG